MDGALEWAVAYLQAASRPHGHRYPGLPPPTGLSDHRLRRQRRRTQGDGGVPAGRPAPVAHRRGQRHQLGTGAGRQRRRPAGMGRARLRRPDLLPASGAHATTPRPADRRADHAAGRGLRGGPRPHRPRPHHQPDDGVAGSTGGPPHDGGNLPLLGPLPGHGAGHGHPDLRHPGDGGATRPPTHRADPTL